MPNFALLAPIILVLPAIILALVAAAAGLVLVCTAWQPRSGTGRVMSASRSLPKTIWIQPAEPTRTWPARSRPETA